MVEADFTFVPLEVSGHFRLGYDVRSDLGLDIHGLCTYMSL